MSKKAKWHKGPPPSLGWWPANFIRSHKLLRWWDGSRWSESAHIYDSPELAARIAKSKTLNSRHVEWTDRPASWPARSRT
jgi:hypothetical protein